MTFVSEFKERDCEYDHHNPTWLTDLVKISRIKPRHASSFLLECTDFENVIFEKIHLAPSEDAEVKRPQNSKCRNSK